MSIINIVLIAVVAFLAGCGGIVDEFQFHQPLVACTLIGIFTGHAKEGIILGGSLQLIALGWANIGAAVAPDAGLASVASSIIMVLALKGGHADAKTAIDTAITLAIPLSIAGLFLSMIVRTLSIIIIHGMDSAAEDADFRKIDRLTYTALFLQGIRIMIPAIILCFIPAKVVTDTLNSMPDWLTGGMAVGGGMVASVGYAMVINIMSSKETWPFFIIGFVLAALPQLTLIGLGALGSMLAVIYMTLKQLATSNKAAVSGSGDALGDILDDFEGLI